MVGLADLLAVLTGLTDWLVRQLGSKKSQGQFVQQSSKAQGLDVGKGKVSKFHMPSHPNLLKRTEVAVAGVKDRVYSPE